MIVIQHRNDDLAVHEVLVARSAFDQRRGQLDALPRVACCSVDYSPTNGRMDRRNRRRWRAVLEANVQSVSVVERDRRRDDRDLDCAHDRF